MTVELVSAVIFDNIRQLIVVTLCITAVVFLLLRHRQRASSATHLPPGPATFPIIGNLPFFIWHGFIGGVQRAAKTYGDMCTLRMGPATVVLLNKRELIREAFSRSEFSGRPDWQSLYGDVVIANAGVADSTGHVWKTNRKLCLRYLRQLGFGKKQFEPEILDEIEYLLHAIRHRNGRKFDIRESLSYAVSNIICRLIFGKRYEYTNEEFVQLLVHVKEFINFPLFPAVILPFPDKLPFFAGAVALFRHAVRKLDNFMDRHLQLHKKEDKHSRVDDLIDAYLNGKNDDSDKVHDKVVFRDEHIRRTILDVFAAGTETTTATLYWMLVYLINFPDVQDKIHAEIHRIVGTDRCPSIADKNELPFTQAFVSEVQRHATLTPFALPHMTTKAVNIRDYEIPENTHVISNLLEVHMNDEDFPSPDVFRPERFIDSAGHFNQALADKIIPFGVGRRVCVGEALSRMVIFLFMTSLVQHFEFRSPCGSAMPPLGGDMQFVYTPRSFELCANSHKQL